jgi:hypothetical protein
MFVTVLAIDTPRAATVATVFGSFSVSVAANASGKFVNFGAFLARSSEFCGRNGIESGVEEEFGSRLADIVAEFAVHGTFLWVVWRDFSRH